MRLAMRLAFDEPSVLRSRTIGESWIAVAGRIAANGSPTSTTACRSGSSPWLRWWSLGLIPTTRSSRLTQTASGWHWMHTNFTDHARVTSLGDCG